MTIKEVRSSNEKIMVKWLDFTEKLISIMVKDHVITEAKGGEAQYIMDKAFLHILNKE